MKYFIPVITINLFIFLFVVSSCAVNDASDEKSNNILLCVKIGDKYGFINEEGDIMIEPQFDDAFYYFSDRVCFATLDGKKGLIDKEGNFIVELPDTVDWIYSFRNNRAIIRFKNGNENIIDADGNLLFDNQYLDVKWDEDESLYFYVKGQDSKWNIALPNGDFLVKSLDSISGISQGLFTVNYNGKWGYLDKTGRLVIDTIYDEAKTFSVDGLARVKKGNEEFYIDKEGNNVIPVDKTRSRFDCNRAFVEIDGNLCLIDKNKNIICEIEADEVFGFNKEDSLATIIRNGKALKIDTNGIKVLSTNYEEIGPFINGVAKTSKNNKYGVIRKDGKEIIPIEYDYLDFIEVNGSNKEIILLEKNRVIEYYDSKGNFIGKDTGLPDAIIPNNHTKGDFIKYFDSKLADLAPLEGIYYVTIKDYYESRENPNRNGLNNSESEFYAVVKNPMEEEYLAYVADGSNHRWVNKFIKIGETDKYAIVKIDKENDYSSEGSMTLENPNSFGFRLERGHNDRYNFFVTYEFVRDYPAASDIEKIQQAEWTGTGFAIADGYIVTNYHVTSGAKRIRVRGINGDMDKSYKGAVVAYDNEHDLSIIRIVDKKYDGIKEIPYSIGKTIVDVGEDVFVLGYPMVESMGSEIKLTEGTISSASGFQGDTSMYQISAAVQPGNSGGPVFNEDGVVIGIVCGKHSDAENANYAIKISYLYSLLNTSKLGIELPDKNEIKGRLSKKVKKVKDFVYLIECNANN